MPCADSSTICARRQVTTDPLPRRTIRTSRRPSSSSISRTRSRSVTGPVSAIKAPRESCPGKVGRANVTCYGTRSGRQAVRREYDHQPDAPAASWVAPCAFAAVRDVTGRLLLVRRCDTGDWELPGGHVDPGESATDAAVRETAEESGITVEITGLVGIYTDPGHVIADPRAGAGAPAVRGVLPCPPAER